MKNKIIINQVGYEVELNSTRHSESSIAESLGLSFDGFTKIRGHNLLIKMSKEYYGSTIEFNFIKEVFNLNLHKKVKKFVNFVMDKFGLTTYGFNPSFVGTHIHFFRSGLDKIDTDIILKIVMEFILDNIDDLPIQSLERVICSHQLWGNYAWTNPDIKDILAEELGKEFAYPSQSRDRPKYRPVIHSPRSTTGKLRSTEIRLIPTEFVLNDKILDLYKRLETLTISHNKDIPTLYINFIKHYKGLLRKPTPEQSPPLTSESESTGIL